MHEAMIYFFMLIIYVYMFFSEIMRSNGFCLVNTENIVFDENVPQDKDRPSSTDSAQHSQVSHSPSSTTKYPKFNSHSVNLV